MMTTMMMTMTMMMMMLMMMMVWYSEFCQHLPLFHGSCLFSMSLLWWEPRGLKFDKDYDDDNYDIDDDDDYDGNDYDNNDVNSDDNGDSNDDGSLVDWNLTKI